MRIKCNLRTIREREREREREGERQIDRTIPVTRLGGL
jgi:hypothetical protein